MDYTGLVNEAADVTDEELLAWKERLKNEMISGRKFGDEERIYPFNIEQTVINREVRRRGLNKRGVPFQSRRDNNSIIVPNAYVRR